MIPEWVERIAPTHLLSAGTNETLEMLTPRQVAMYLRRLAYELEKEEDDDEEA